jgi:hypothetical protein
MRVPSRRLVAVDSKIDQKEIAAGRFSTIDFASGKALLNQVDAAGE